MNIDEKINILLIIATIQLIIVLIGSVVRIKNEFSTIQISRRSRKLSALDSEGKFVQIVKLSDAYMETWPNEASFKWSKARALFKLEKYSEALALFSELKEQEPSWEEDARKYISTINSKLQKT